MGYQQLYFELRAGLPETVIRSDLNQGQAVVFSPAGLLHFMLDTNCPPD